MARVVEPLARMGARIQGGDRLPLRLAGGRLNAIRYRLPMASAQVKSAVLLAGLNALGATEVVEPAPTRDHTERMLAAFGGNIEIATDGHRRAPDPHRRSPELVGGGLEMPGDPSSAAFLLVAALIVPGSDITVRNVLLNPLRTGLFDTLLEMGADLSIRPRSDDRRRAGRRRARAPFGPERRRRAGRRGRRR